MTDDDFAQACMNYAASRRALFVSVASSALAGCAAWTDVAQAEGLIDASGHINVYATIAGIGKAALVTLLVLDPPAGAAVQAALAIGTQLVAAMQNGATANQVAQLSTQTQTINQHAAPLVTVAVHRSAA